MLWYNKGAERKVGYLKSIVCNTRKAGKFMNAEMKFTGNKLNFDSPKKQSASVDDLKAMGVVSDKCSCSVYSMVTVAGGILLAVGTVIYSLIAM